ncbi:hypothetical protein [Nocardioides sp.]|uniref:hypothetical protein n=1 Tax=Nocardioides sp. TaxID=35761 RepID=UPI002EDA63A5
MTRLDHGRRATVVLLVLAALVLVPSVAAATFTSRQAVAVTVGTDRMETPTDVTGSYRCALPFFTEGVDVEVDTFTDAGPAGATYDYRLTGPGVDVTVTSTQRSVSMTSGGVPNDLSATHWTLTITSRLGSWTGTPSTHKITCPALRPRSGVL